MAPLTRAGARPRRLILLVLALLGALALASSSASAVVVGISDSDPATFTEPYWDGLHMTSARIVVPYDVAITTGSAGLARQRTFETYLANAAIRGVSVEAAFSASVDVLAPGTNDPVAPSADQFAAAFTAFHARYPQVTTIAPWNEPNNPDATQYPLGSDPGLAADYWLQAQAICPSCTVIAGDFAGISGDDDYVDAYQAALGAARPLVWAFHAHGDVNNFQADGPDDARISRYYLSKFQGQWSTAQVWIDEVGARFRDASSVIWGDDSQQQATEFLLGLATLDPRITLIDYYNYSNQCSQAATCAVQDRGLVSPTPFNGDSPGYDAPDRPRAAYTVIANRGPVISPALSVPPAVTIATPAQSAELRDNTPTFTGQAATGGRAQPSVTLQIFPGAGSTEGSTPVLTSAAPVVGLGWSLTTSVLPDGTYTAQATQVGNSRSAGTSQAVVFTIDTVPPTSTITGTPVSPTGLHTAKLTFAASEPGSTFRCSVDGRASKACTSPVKLAHLAVGEHSLAVRATDAAGNPQAKPTKVRWQLVALATTLVPRSGSFPASFSSGVPVAAGCAAACRVEARLYAPLATAKAAGLAGRGLARGDPARPAGNGYLVVASGAIVRPNAGSPTLALRLRAASAKAVLKTKGVRLRLGLVLSSHGSKPVAVSRIVTLTRRGNLAALAKPGLPVTLACTSACSGRTALWITRTVALGLRLPGGNTWGGGSTGLPAGTRYVSLGSAPTDRTRGGATDLTLTIPRQLRGKVPKLKSLAFRVAALPLGPGTPVRALSWPLTLGR